MARLSLARKQKLIIVVQNLIVILDIILTVCTIVSAYAWINSRRCLNQPLSIMRGKLKNKTRNVFVEEMVAMFLYILAHHHKNRVVGYSFKRLGKTASKYFHECLNAMIRCQKEFWKTLEPIFETSINPRWKWF
ncbi:hypothetical protein F8388_008694, partial [Cannabis sativa]